MSEDVAIVDACVLKQSKGLVSLPAAYREDWHRYFLALTHYESGDDAGMLEALRGISARSPFAEWKLMLRGQLAYAQSDDARAIDNWSRLQTTRVPYRLIAPLWQQIDPAYAARQSAEGLARLQRIHQQLSPPTSATHIALIRKLAVPPSANSRGMSTALKGVRTFIRTWQKTHPASTKRLAKICYWLLLEQGTPNDLITYADVFGPPEQDPEFERLRAVVMEKLNEPEQQATFWGAYIERLGTGLPGWQPEAARFAQGILSARIAQCFKKVLGEIPLHLLPAKQRKELNEIILEQLSESYRYAPELREATTGYLRQLIQNQHYDRALEVGNAHVNRYPYDSLLLSGMAQLHLLRKEFDQTWEYAQKIAELESLSQERMIAAGYFVMQCLRHWATQKTATEKVKALLDFHAAHNISPVTVWAIRMVIAQKAKDAATCAQLNASPPTDHPCLLSYIHLVEAIRLKVVPAAKKVLADAFLARLSQPCDLIDLFETFKTLHQNKAIKPAYTGIKVHEKAILDRFDVDAKTVDADTLVTVCKRWHQQKMDYAEYWSKQKFQALFKKHLKDPRIVYYRVLPLVSERSIWSAEREIQAALRKLQSAEYAAYAAEYQPLLQGILDEMSSRDMDPFFFFR